MRPVEHVKLRMKIGAHELEAEGPRDFAMAQVEIWSRLAGLPAASSAADRTGQPADSDLASLFSVDPGRQAIALRARLGGRTRNADAALLLLWAIRDCSAATAERRSPSSACAPRWPHQGGACHCRDSLRGTQRLAARRQTSAAARGTPASVRASVSWRADGSFLLNQRAVTAGRRGDL